MNEVERIEMLRRLLSQVTRGVDVGIGDDAAVLSLREGGPPGGKLVWTVDEQVEGTHFRRSWLAWRDIGWRSFMAALSDVAAMGATPWCALCALVLPDDVTDDALAEIAGGQAEASEACGAPIVGGNLARGPALSIATTVLGTCDGPVLRRGAREGDALWLAGPVGLAAAGMRAIATGRESEAALAGAVAAWRRPVARIIQGLAMARLAHAAIDVSDGLARDAAHVAQASGVRLVLDAGAIAAERALHEAATAMGVDSLDLALHGGEDYALLASSAAPIDGFRRVGEVVAGSGVVLRTKDRVVPLEPRGYDHFPER